MKSEAFLKQIRRAEGLSRAVLKKITVEKNTVTFHLVTDKTYSKEDIALANAVATTFVPEGYTGEVSVMKSVPSEEGIRAEIATVIRENFPSASAFLKKQDIAVDIVEGGGRFLIGIDEAERTQFDRNNVLNVLVSELGKRYCGVWHGDFRTIKKEMGEITEEVPEEELVYAPRFFKIENFEMLDGARPTQAIYISDLKGEQHGITVCGTVNYIEERLTKTGKPYFSITISDASGSLRTCYFTRKATVERVRGIQKGDVICLTGDNELFNGAYSFRAKNIDFGTPPKNFVVEMRPSRAVPSRYQAVFPEQLLNPVQSDLFGEKPLPKAFLSERFVVFDLETTGLNSSPKGGVMDRIIEVGAVKIEKGMITERFTTFVACPVKLSEEIVKKTGITDDMLVGAPDVSAVIADFYKFSYGYSLVGHNVQFDCGFIRFYGEKEGYLFDQRTYDTLTLSQEQLRLKNYKLNTVAEHFSFDFNHHRAYEDAFVTAKIFIELVRLKGGLPL